MIYIEKISMSIPGVTPNFFELGDLTIFIGKSNSGKTRILNGVNEKINTPILLRMRSERTFDVFTHLCGQENISLTENMRKIFSDKKFNAVYIKSPRSVINDVDARSKQYGRFKNSLEVLDNLIVDCGPKTIEFSGDQVRPISEQGSGIHNCLQILKPLHDPNHIVLIDEPEISHFPYGKIELLRVIIESLETKQIVFATHDPTLINHYLIKEMMTNKNYKIVIYSFSGDCFKKIDFLTDWNPETHVGYLSQTYSGKPVHLVLEGETDYYAFQAFLFQYCRFNKIPHFQKYTNKIELSQLGGGQWEINIHHLPDTRYYKTLVLLDGEHESNLKKIKENKFKVLEASLVNISDDKVNIVSLKSKNIEEVSKKIFKDAYPKPLGLADKIWSLSEDEFNKLDWNDPDLKLIKEAIEWCLKKAGCQAINNKNGTSEKKSKNFFEKALEVDNIFIEKAIEGNL